MTPDSATSPAFVHELPVSAEFKKQTIKAIASIGAFVVVYLLLIAISLALVVASASAGIWIIIAAPKFLTILFGLGLVGLGIMVFVFLIKFLFARSEADHSDSIEITAEDQPRLVAFIHQVAAKANTPAPRKIFISGDVNACVFYNSSFWSMFLPVRKNLKIGLGLVNALNVSEFKAVVAHEFGHFSQRSMKLGSYTYHVNRIIHDMLFQNNGYGRSLNTWSEIHGVFALFAHITVQIIRAIQWVLRQMYTLVNKSYMALSRQMEFHADLIAASISGNNNIVASLRKLEFSDACFHSTLTLCNQLLRDNKRVTDIYEHHRTVSRFVAQAHGVPFRHGMPELDDHQHTRPANRVNFKDQWASHPTLEERRDYVEGFDLYQPAVEESAWMLFNNAAPLKEALTQKLYEHLPAEGIVTAVGQEEFEALYSRQEGDFTLPAVFRGYFDSRQVALMDVAQLTAPAQTPVSFDELLGEEQATLPKKIEALTQDIAVLWAIERKEVATKTFDFDGQKYDRKQAAAIRATLSRELEAAQQTLAALDQELFRFFYARAASASTAKADELKQAYTTYFHHRTEADTYGTRLDEMIAVIGPLYSGETLGLESINHWVGALKSTHEPLFKKNLAHWMALGAFERDAALEEKVAGFIEKDYQYFSGTDFFENELNELRDLIQESWNAMNLFLFEAFKGVLQLQASLLPAAEKKPAGKTMEQPTP